MSFPQVEGPTSVADPASGRLDEPISAHARTRLAEERLLMERTRETSTTPIVLRFGMVYGRGILMVEAARWLARRRLLCVWREPTLLQLISTVRLLARHRSGHLRARGARHLPRRRRAPGHRAGVPRPGGASVGLSSAETRPLLVDPGGGRGLRGCRARAANEVAADSRLRAPAVACRTGCAPAGRATSSFRRLECRPKRARRALILRE